MKSFIKKIFDGESDDDSHRHFVRFGKGNYRGRFIINLNKGKKIKLRGSFEFANDFVNFVRDNNKLKFSGSVLMKNKIDGMVGKKKAGSFIYEVSESSLEEFENPYFYLCDANGSDIVLKIKKKLPKPGKAEGRVDDKFCSMDLDLKYWDKVKEVFFWDVPESVKKVKIAHDLNITDIEMPSDVDDPVKVREMAKRKGKIVRRLEIDGVEKNVEKEFVG